METWIVILQTLKIVWVLKSWSIFVYRKSQVWYTMRFYLFEPVSKNKQKPYQIHCDDSTIKESIILEATNDPLNQKQKILDELTKSINQMTIRTIIITVY